VSGGGDGCNWVSMEAERGFTEDTLVWLARERWEDANPSMIIISNGFGI
jgi:hypothetical protein